MSFLTRAARAALALATTIAADAAAQIAPSAAPPRRGIERSVLPALNFDADEGLGYGAIAELYDYGDGSARPYRWTLQPTLFLTTAGRRDLTVFLDAPGVLPAGWRVDAYAGIEHQVASPFYGLGNESRRDEAREDEDGPNPYYYRYGIERRQLSANVQRRVGASPLRVLLGAGVAHARVDDTPFDSGTTLVAEGGVALGPRTGWSNGVRAGLVWDTRDREVAPRTGAWSELLVHRVDRALGSSRGYTRWTVTDRRYATAGRVTLAYRALLQGVSGDAPFHDLPIIASSFKQQEGLGGARTLRGVARNRWVGEGYALLNAEARWRALEFRAPVLNRPSHLVLSAFHDEGRVWESLSLRGVLRDTHGTTGGGMRLGLGESFVIAADAGWRKAGAPSVYVGLGYLF